MKFKKSLTLLAFAASAIMAAKAYALTNYDVYTYYADASYSTEVGTLTKDCDGKKYFTGTASAYRLLTVREYCCGLHLC